MIFHDIEQNTDAWLLLRSGMATSSKLGVIMASSSEYVTLTLGKDAFGVANTKTKKLMAKRYANKIEADAALRDMQKKDLSKAFGEQAKKYAINICIEILTGAPISDGYSNDDMERGHEQEPVARMLYEELTFSEVLNGGFFELENVGCSPDGLVAKDGVIEIKSVIPSTHYANIKRQSFDPAYKWQCIGNLKFTERNWLDFVSYCETFPEDKRLFVYRLNRAEYLDEFKMIDERLELFRQLIVKTMEEIEQKEYFLMDKAA